MEWSFVIILLFLFLCAAILMIVRYEWKQKTVKFHESRKIN
jgi:hypothetical protein